MSKIFWMIAVGTDLSHRSRHTQVPVPATILETTNIYAEVNLEMKAKALLNCEMKAKNSKKHWRDDKNLMAFLDSL